MKGVEWKWTIYSIGLRKGGRKIRSWELIWIIGGNFEIKDNYRHWFLGGYRPIFYRFVENFHMVFTHCYKRV